jgi:hypothetical protein
MYLPLYAEKRCKVCGHWRGQHLLSEYGNAGEDADMHCPTTSTFEAES